MSMTTISINKNAVALRLHKSSWGNRKQANKDMIETAADKDMLGITKSLVYCNEYKEIIKVLRECDKWIEKRSMQSFFNEATYMFSIEMIESAEKRLSEFQAELAEKVEALIAVFPEKKIEAQEKLKNQWNESDYPTEAELRGRFGIRWNWTKFDVPDTLPENIFKMEKERTEKQWSEASAEITQALRLAFAQLIDRAVTSLSSEDGKAKRFKSSMVSNMDEFIELFKYRNLTNDTELAELVEKARAIISGTTAEELRAIPELREYTAMRFEEVQKTLDGMVENKPKRKFKFDD